MADQPFEVDPLYIIAALLEVTGGEAEVPAELFENGVMAGTGIALEDHRETTGNFVFKLVRGEE
jgi:hypothetical protein